MTVHSPDGTTVGANGWCARTRSLATNVTKKRN